MERRRDGGESSEIYDGGENIERVTRKKKKTSERVGGRKRGSEEEDGRTSQWSDTQLCSAKGLRDSRERQQLTSPETFSEQHSHTLTESCTTKKESASNCKET
ncbi:hypothetical protein V1477_011995 [Vespula maculifrons]|uniref:Uncharacterized protein n=2 Tax=Vespula TaxID=7451 RepID=A0A834KPR5_VESPE|nr:hypothetical protein H0235_013245 [Vespula pensylvanica]